MKVTNGSSSFHGLAHKQEIDKNKNNTTSSTLFNDKVTKTQEIKFALQNGDYKINLKDTSDKMAQNLLNL